MNFSKEFSRIIESINDSKLENEVVDFLIELVEGTDIGVNFDIDFVDCDPDSDDMITFLSEKRLKKMHKDDEEKSFKAFVKKIKNDKDVWKSDKKTKIKIGRFINKLADKAEYCFSDTDLENFINAFKGFNALNKGNSKFEIVKGEDIRKYYLYTNYQNMNGHLGSSCMRFKKCQDFLNLYVENPKICKLLILRGDNEKIIGRALIWKTVEGENYLDRVYANNDSDIILFNEYAKRKLGCKLSYDKIFSYDSDYVELSIKPTKIEFKKYPYMDTFRFLYLDKGVLYTAPMDSDEFYYELEMTNGLIENDDN